MIENIDFALVNWSRGQFAMVVLYHWLFIPVTIGTTYIIAISSWYLLKKREVMLAKRSMVTASVFGLTGILMVVLTGDRSAYNVAQHQPAMASRQRY